MLGWKKHKLESRLPGEISITSDTQMIPLIAESEEELKNLLMKVKEKSEKAGLKLSIPKTKIMASRPITSGFPHSSVSKESACNAGDPSLIPGSGRFPGEGIGYPLQYS